MFQRKFFCSLVIPALFVVVMAAALTGCGGHSNPISIAVTAAASTVDGADTTTLTATVTNDKNAAGVTWSVSGAGTLTNTTTTSATYTAPAPISSSQTATITATSIADSTKTGTATITIPAMPSVTSTDASLAGAVGSTYSITLQASGGIAPYTWALADGSLPSCLTLSTSGVITTTSGTAPTASCAGTFSNITFKVTDSGTPTPLTETSAAMTITITAASAITFTGAMPAAATWNQPYTGSAAATGGAGTLTYTMATGSGPLPTGLALAASSGAVTGTPTAAGKFPFTIQAADGFGDSATQAYTITVSYPTLTVTPATLPTGYVGGAYPSTTLAATGGSGTGYTWALASGSSLPAGLSLSSAGVITGQPSGAPATTNFSVVVTDSAKNTGTGSFSITVDAGLAITTTSPLPSGYGGTAYSQTLTISGGTGTGLTWTVTSGSSQLTAVGLSLSSAGVLSGSSPVAGSASFAVKVTDSANNAATANLSVTIKAGLAITTGATLPEGYAGTAYSQTLATSGGTGTGLTWSVTSGSSSLTAVGLSVSAAGVVSGTTPVAGSASFTVKVTDSNGNAATQTFSVTIGAGLAITTPSPLPEGYVGTAYSETLATSGGTGTGLTWTLTAGSASLTAVGLSESGGVVSGPTPILGSASFSVKVTDSYGNTASQTFSVTIGAGLTITTTSPLPVGYGGTAYSETLATSGGTGMGLTWSVTSGSSSLTAVGLSVSSSGVISGSTPVAGTASFGVKVTDSANNTATGNFSVTIDTGLSITTSTTLPAGYAGTAYSQALATSGGTGSGLTWTITSGGSSLTAVGLSVSSSGVISGSTPVAGTASFTVKVTDSYGNSATQTFSVTIEAKLAIATTSPLPAGVVATPYSQTLVATGGSGGYSWATNTAGTTSLTGVGLTFSTSGVVSGSSPILGSATFTATVTDSASHTASLAFTVQITNALTITTTSASLPPAYTNVAYSQTLAAAGGTGSGFTWSTTGTSNLATFNLTLSGTGLLSGTPTTTGTASFTAKVTDSGGHTATQALSIPVYAQLALPAANPASLGPATTNQLYSGTITATGGSGSGYVFTVTGLPSDSLSNAANNGSATLTIGGTPTLSQTASFQVSVKDGLGNTAGPVTYTIKVNPPTPLTLQAGGSLPAATTNVAYNGSVNASGGSGSGYVFTVNGTQIPTTGVAVLIADSISVSSTGTATLSISGTPTLTQEVTLTSVKVKDGAGDTAGPDTYTIAVNPPTPLTLPTSGALNSATTGENYGCANCVNASGGSGSGYTFTVNVNGVPTTVPYTGNPLIVADGIGVTSNGNQLIIGGTPTTVTTVDLVVSVKDGAGDAAGPDTYTIAVNAPGSQVSGQIMLLNNCNNNGQTLPTYTVSINTNPVQTATTDGTGTYSFASIPNGTYTVTPSMTGSNLPEYEFYPGTLTNVVVDNNGLSGENFVVSLGYTFSGTLTYGGTTTGPIYLQLNNDSCGPSNGTTISAPGSFTIRGVAPGTYNLNSWRDNLGYGQQNASNPAGSLSNITVSTANLTGQSITITDPGAVTLSTAPTLGTIDGFADGAFINYTPLATGNQVETATSYTVEWSTTTTFATPSSSNSHSFAATGANNTDVWILNAANVTGLSAGGAYYFRAQGVNASSTSPWSSTVGPITLTAPSAANTVTGQITWTGAATGPLYVVFYENSTGQGWITQVGSKTAVPTSPATYTVEVPDGTYGFAVIIDQNNDGLIDAGDITDVNSNNNNGGGPPNVTISGSATENATLPSTNSNVSVRTQFSQFPNGSGGTSTNYGLNLEVRQGIKLPIAVTLASGPNLINPVDMASSCSGCSSFQYNAGIGPNVPNVGDTYTFNVTYSDGTTGTVSGAVTGVLTSSALPTLISPTGSDIGDTPSFDWTYPANPGNYVYQFGVCCSSNGTIWAVPANHSNSNGFTSSQITPPLVWGVDPTNSGNLPSPSSLSAGTYYSWAIRSEDANGNEAQAQLNFETTPGPVSLPAASSNPLPSGVVSVPYSGTINASGGAGGQNYYFVVNGATIPTNMDYVTVTNSDGLTFANNGFNGLFVGGTPTTAESVSLTVEVVDTTNSSDTATVTYTVVINNETPVSLPAASSNPLGPPLVGYPYSGNLNASGGPGGGNYSFTVNGTAIPTNNTATAAANSDGLTFTNSGGNTLFVGGTPAAAETFSLEVTVTDTTNSSDTATVTYSITATTGPNGANNGNLKGTYVCKTNGYKDSNGSAWASLSSVIANGSGGLSSGIWDQNGQNDTTSVSGTVTGTYSIGADNNGMMTTTSVATSGGTGSISQTWAVALTNATSPAQEFRMIETDDVGSSPSGQHSTGDCYLATTSAFALSTFNGGFVFSYNGANGAGTPAASLAVMSLSDGTLNSGYSDNLTAGSTTDQIITFISGSISTPDTTYGRATFSGTASQGTGTSAVYIIDANRMFILMTGAVEKAQSGDMRKQQQSPYSDANLSGPAVLYSQAYFWGSNGLSGYKSGIDQVTWNSAGTFTVNQNYDDNEGTYQVGTDSGGSATITFDTSNPGRATVAFGTSETSYFYFFADNSALYIDETSTGDYLATGWIEPQSQTTFTDAAVAGNYLLGQLPQLEPGSNGNVGEFDMLSNGNITEGISTAGVGDFTWDDPISMTYAWDTTATGTGSFLIGSGSKGASCMVISSTRAACIFNGDDSPSVMILQQ